MPSSLSKAARELLSSTAIRRIEDLENEADEQRAVWGGLAEGAEMTRARLADAKSQQIRNRNKALELGLEPDPAQETADQHEVDKRKRASETAIAKSNAAMADFKNIETVLESAISYINGVAFAAVKAGGQNNG